MKQLETPSVTSTSRQDATGSATFNPSDTDGASTVSPATNPSELLRVEVEGLATDSGPSPQPVQATWLHGVVGGCGTTTLAAALDHPESTTLDVDRLPPGATVLLACPTTADGTSRLMAAVDEIRARADLQLVVVACHDGRGPLPRAARARLRRLASLARVVHVPWVPAWRWSGHDPDTASRGYRAALGRLAALVERRQQTSPVTNLEEETNP